MNGGKGANSVSEMPVIRLEIDRMKFAIMRALSTHMAQIDSDITKAVEQYCTSENIKRVIAKQTEEEINRAIKEETERFFRYGAGRHAIAEAVTKALLER